MQKMIDARSLLAEQLYVKLGALRAIGVVAVEHALPDAVGALRRGLRSAFRPVAEIGEVGDQRLINRADSTAPLTREQFDLIDIPANTLVLDRLLPGREIAIGNGWDNTAEAIGALLGLDHVGACQVRSIAGGVERDQVQIRMEGTVNGTADGETTELDVQAAYLFHLKYGRITKFNLAVTEKRKAGEIGPGLDVTAKLTLVVKPVGANESPFDADAVAAATDADPQKLGLLAVDDAKHGFHFLHGQEWFVTGEQADI